MRLSALARLTGLCLVNSWPGSSQSHLLTFSQRICQILPPAEQQWILSKLMEYQLTVPNRTLMQVIDDCPYSLSELEEVEYDESTAALVLRLLIPARQAVTLFGLNNEQKLCLNGYTDDQLDEASITSCESLVQMISSVDTSNDIDHFFVSFRENFSEEITEFVGSEQPFQS